MRYRPEHKARTRRRILTWAGRLFRRHGYQGVGIDRIMRAAKLTHGGFYGHFRSKSELFAAVVGDEHDFITRMRARPGPTREALRRQALEQVNGYLAPENRERVGTGCHLASLSVDVARAGPAARRAYSERLRELADEFARSLPDAADADPRALASIALCVGGLVLARAAEPELADAIGAACADAVDRELR